MEADRGEKEENRGKRGGGGEVEFSDVGRRREGASDFAEIIENCHGNK